MSSSHVLSFVGKSLKGTHCLFKHLCTTCWNYFFLVPSAQATFIFQAKTSRRPRGPWCAQNKFNICQRIKWLCSPANEKSQTFENCLATLPAHKKLSVTSFFRGISLSLSLCPYPPLPPFFLPCSFRFLSIEYLLLSPIIFFRFSISHSCPFFIHMYCWMSSPFLATERDNMFYGKKWCDTP